MPISAIARPIDDKEGYPGFHASKNLNLRNSITTVFFYDNERSTSKIYKNMCLTKRTTFLYIVVMVKETYLYAPLVQTLCGTIPAAEKLALCEAADTGGVILRVKSLRIEPNRVVIIGLIPLAALVNEHTSTLPGYIRPRSIGNFHPTWNSVHQPNANGDLGYLVLQTPVAALGLPLESEDGDSYWVALPVERTFRTLAPHSIGAVCCAQCNRPISRQRLLAVPNTRTCTDCQQKKERT